MVSYTRRNRPRPLWIVKIRQRLSIRSFKRNARELKKDADINWVLKGPLTEKVYKVTVETMENCGTAESMQDIWVTEEMAKATGGMLESFEEFEDSIEEDSCFSDSDEDDYKMLRDTEELDPYESDPDDDDESFWNFKDLEEPEKDKGAEA